jgi:tetratricopeptide (TPR) repeat protein
LHGAGVAQAGGARTIPPSNVPPPTRPPTADFDQRHVELESQGPKSLTVAGRDTCFLPPLSGIEFPTVGVANLEISSKAKKEYAGGCAALKGGRFDTAEESFRKAVKYEPKYLAAWVTLGQMQAARQKLDDAHTICTNSRSLDAKYIPAYLCLADVAARSEHWDEVLAVSQRAVELDPATDPAAYDYNAAALMNLHRLPEAEKSAMKALEIDRNHADPRVHFLLAQIYEAEGDKNKEIAQLEEFLKYASAEEAANVKQYLSDLKK